MYDYEKLCSKYDKTPNEDIGMYKLFGKRLCDVILAGLIFPFFLVMCLMVQIAILFDDKGPLFYVADRLGKNGKIFRMYKFRSMKVNAPDLRNADGTTFNSKEDTRVTRIGRFLRKTSLDEIPQILNVFIGNMSFIGPRPDLPGADKELYRPGDMKKLDVRPGITGYSQAYYRNSSTLEQRFDGDVYYADNLSFILDLKILFKTFKTVLTSENVYRN